jgi:cell division protein FtsA
MNYEDPFCIIDLGNINIKCLIFKIKNNNDTEILSTSITPSEGIYNDAIINLSKATNAIRRCVSNAEKKAKISLKKIHVVFEQIDFLCTKFSIHKKINGSQIDREDIEFLLKEAKNQLILNDKNQYLIHIFNHNYIVDGKIFLEEPINVYADSLTHEITFITTPKNNIKNINQVFYDCDLEIEGLISRTFALNVNLLSEKDLNLGSALINLEFDKISLGLFKNLALVHSINIPIGTNHIAKDISKVCSLSLEESQKIKSNINFSLIENQHIFDENNFLKKEYFIDSVFRKISKDLIINVIKARLDEVSEKLAKQLVLGGFNLNSGINVFLVSEDSKIKNLEKYFMQFFKLNVTRLNKMSSSNEEMLENNFCSSLGAVKIIKDGWETEAIPETRTRNVEKISFFSKIFKKL